MSGECSPFCLGLNVLINTEAIHLFLCGVRCQINGETGFNSKYVSWFECQIYLDVTFKLVLLEMVQFSFFINNLKILS